MVWQHMKPNDCACAIPTSSPLKNKPSARAWATTIRVFLFKPRPLKAAGMNAGAAGEGWSQARFAGWRRTTFSSARIRLEARANPQGPSSMSSTPIHRLPATWSRVNASPRSGLQRTSPAAPAFMPAAYQRFHPYKSRDTLFMPAAMVPRVAHLRALALVVVVVVNGR